MKPAIRFIRNTTLLTFLLMTSKVHAQGLISETGTHIVPTGNVYLVIKDGSFNNNGTYAPGAGYTSFTGSTATSSASISGTGTSSFYDLILNKSSKGIQLGQSVAVKHLLDLQSGDSIFLNGFNIDLGTTGSISGEAENRRITGQTGGYIVITADLNAPAAVNPGNIGISIASSANLGTTTIRRGHQQQGGKSIYRYFDISPANNNALNATLSFQYFNAELAAVSEGNLAYFSSSNSGSTWANLGENGIDPFSNVVTLVGVNSMNRLTLSDFSQPLYVRLLYFRASMEENTNLLYWASVAENDSHSFVIQRSADGMSFSDIGTVNAAGNSAVNRYYQFRDAEVHTGRYFYRLKMTDQSGHATYSGIVMLDRTEQNGVSMKVWPNPAQVHATLSINATSSNDLIIEVRDQSGKLILKRTEPGYKGPHTVTIDISGLPSGIYNMYVPALKTPAIKLLKL